MALGFYVVIAVDNASVSHVVAMSVSQATRRHIQWHLAPLGRQDDVDAPLQARLLPLATVSPLPLPSALASVSPVEMGQGHG